jgi:hypothetical protein
MEDLNKIQEFFSKPLEEMDMNDPVLMKMRAAKMKSSQPTPEKTTNPNYPSNKNSAKLAFLKKERAQLMRDMEQEAEPEGGPIADEYGSKLNRTDKAIAKLSGRKEMDYDTAVGKVDENKLLKQAKLSSAEYQKVKKLKDFNPNDYEWDPSESLYVKEKKSKFKKHGEMSGFDMRGIDEASEASKFKKGDKITYYGNKGVVNSAKYNPFAKDWDYTISYIEDGTRKGESGVRDKELKSSPINEAKFTDYSNNELAAYAKELSKQRADAASKGQNDLVSGINKEIEAATRELKKRSQKLKDLSRTDVKEPVGEEENDQLTEVTLKKGDIVNFADGKKFYIIGPKGDGYEFTTDDNQRAFQLKKWFDMMFTSGKASVNLTEETLTEANVPSNIAEFAKRKGVSSLVKIVAGWAEKVGKRIVGGTAIGKNYDTLILDMTYQGSEIRINTEYETIELYDEPVRTFAQFKRVYEENQEENLDEAITDLRIDNPKFGPAPKQFADLRAKLGDESLLDKIQMINVNVLRDLLDELDSYTLEEGSYDPDQEQLDDEDEIFMPMDDEGRPLGEVEIGDKVKINKEYGGGKGKVTDKIGSFIVVNGESYHESDVEESGMNEEEGYSKFLKDDPEFPGGKTKGLTPDVMNKILMKIVQDIDETKKLGKNLTEELCPKGKAYIKKRQAAGEKSSAYLSGRAVKVCKGQMEG